MRLAARLTLVLLPLLPVYTGAQVYFTGALMYNADASGNDVSGAYEYDTFSTPNTNNSKFTVNGSTDIAFPLSAGTNSFSVSGGSVGPNVGFGLFFSNTATTFTGPFSAVPNLVVVDNVGAPSTFAFATTGAQISTYGQYSGEVAYSGVVSYLLGGYSVTVTSFDYYSGTASATLVLTLTAVPEPGTWTALAGLVGLGFAAYRRRQPRRA